MKRLVLLRPEPGLSASAAGARALGLEVVTHPLFSVEPVAWRAPPGAFDGLVFTSANAVRHGGIGLEQLKAFPSFAVGDATAAAARAAGFKVVHVGRGGVSGLVLPEGRFLHLTGARSHAVAGDVVAVPVYRTVPTGDPLPDLIGAVVAVHSPAAGERLASLVSDRDGIDIAAISAAATEACGTGWSHIESASSPDDASLLALAAALCQSGDV